MSAWIHIPPIENTQRELRRAYLVSPTNDDQTKMTQMRLSALVITKILDDCVRLGITPYTSEISTIDIPALIREATMEIGIHNHPDIDRLVRYAYSVFVRMTSGEMIK